MPQSRKTCRTGFVFDIPRSPLPVADHDVAGLDDAEEVGGRSDGEVHAAVAAATLLVQRAAERGLPVGIVQADDVATNGIQ